MISDEHPDPESLEPDAPGEITDAEIIASDPNLSALAIQIEQRAVGTRAVPGSLNAAVVAKLEGRLRKGIDAARVKIAAETRLG